MDIGTLGNCDASGLCTLDADGISGDYFAHNVDAVGAAGFCDDGDTMTFYYQLPSSDTSSVTVNTGDHVIITCDHDGELTIDVRDSSNNTKLKLNNADVFVIECPTTTSTDSASTESTQTTTPTTTPTTEAAAGTCSYTNELNGGYIGGSPTNPCTSTDCSSNCSCSTADGTTPTYSTTSCSGYMAVTDTAQTCVVKDTEGSDMTLTCSSGVLTASGFIDTDVTNVEYITCAVFDAATFAYNSTVAFKCPNA